MLGGRRSGQNQALEQTRDSVLRYGEPVGRELLTFSFGTLIRGAGEAVSEAGFNVAMPELSRFYGIIIRMY